MPALVSGVNSGSKHRKLTGYNFYRDVLGSPKYVLAPMVDQSELAWRILCRRYGAQLTYTPMINAKIFVESHKQRSSHFDIPSGEEGSSSHLPIPSSPFSSPNSPLSSLDRPLIVQFCANNPTYLLQAAQLVEPYCDAVDINFGCPQDIARRGRYGSYLQDDWKLVFELINTLHKNLSIPVTAKFRVFPSIEKTVEYAKMMESAGAQILACHGRTREQRGHNTGLASYAHIAAVKRAVSVPVFANGNILFHADIQRCLDETGADGVMVAEAGLYNPLIFQGCGDGTPYQTSFIFESTSALIPPTPVPLYTYQKATYLPSPHLSLEYLSIVRGLKTRTALSAVKGHLFKLLRPALGVHTDLRARLGSVRGGGGSKEGDEEALAEYEGIVREVAERLEPMMKEVANKPIDELVVIDEATGLPVLPCWLAQPYFRPLPSIPRSKSAQPTSP
ncbi:FMN-linked oxidoreductase [Rickenella mellea]|uniref:tRNA-dihydrouridine(16/17) synthase [NAD(P)(+)] n=1 Tax=Rickenella mellea TaxID=50990 RepID=A0A4Y7PQK8_9AGAM|nr:FMN-linked oxidoreductase [Rickenella mellea]